MNSAISGVAKLETTYNANWDWSSVPRRIVITHKDSLDREETMFIVELGIRNI
jgi:hypothetical protein